MDNGIEQDRKAAIQKSDVETLTEEILGLNYRGLRTLWTLLVFPRRVFTAFATRDLVPYTPPLRIWLTLMSLGVIASVLWGGYAGILLSQFLPDATPLNPPDFVPPANSAELPGCHNLADVSSPFPGQVQEATGQCFSTFAEAYGDWAAVLHAPLIGVVSLLNIFVLSAMTRNVQWRALWNIVFGFQATASFFGLTIGTVLLSMDVSPYIIQMIVPIVVLYVFLRSGRGLFATSWTGLVMKGLIFTFTWMAILMLGGLIMGFIAMMGPLIFMLINA